MEIPKKVTAEKGDGCRYAFGYGLCTCQHDMYQIAGLPLEPYMRLSYPINALLYVESVKFSP